MWYAIGDSCSFCHAWMPVVTPSALLRSIDDLFHISRELIVIIFLGLIQSGKSPRRWAYALSTARGLEQAVLGRAINLSPVVDHRSVAVRRSTIAHPPINCIVGKSLEEIAAILTQKHSWEIGTTRECSSVFCMGRLLGIKGMRETRRVVQVRPFCWVASATLLLEAGNAPIDPTCEVTSYGNDILIQS